MQLRHIAWSGMKRRRGRALFMLSAVALAIGTVVSLAALSAAMRAEVGDELDRFGANIVITPKTRALDLAYGAVALGGLSVDTNALTLDDAKRVRTIHDSRNISAVAPKLVGTIEIDGTPMLLVGADLHEERAVKGWWQVEGRMALEAGEAMLGAEAATALERSVGDHLEFAGKRLDVVGVLAANGTIDDQAVFVDLALAQHALAKPGAVTFIEVSALCQACPIEEIVAQIGAVLPHARVAPIRQAVAAREKAVRQFERFAWVIGALVLIVGALVVTTTMMAAVTERTQEIGILRAVGFRREHVARVVLLETMAVTIAGGTAGWLAGTGAARVLGPVLAQLSEPVAADPRLAAAAVGAALLLGLAGGAYPARRASRMDPAQALRHF